MSLVAYFSVWTHRNPLDRRAVPSRSFKACSQNSPVQPVRTLFLPPPPPTPAGHGLPPSTSDSVSQPAHASPETCRVPRTMRHGDSESHNIKNHESLDKIWIIEPSRRHAIECAVGPEPRRMSRAVDILTPASQTVWAMPKICRLHVLCATMGAK